MGYNVRTITRMESRVNELIEGLEHYVNVFDNAKLFTGPSLHFHLKTIDLLHRFFSKRSS